MVESDEPECEILGLRVLETGKDDRDDVDKIWLEGGSARTLATITTLLGSRRDIRRETRDHGLQKIKAVTFIRFGRS